MGEWTKYAVVTSIITDRVGRQEVLLLINHNFNQICDIWSLLKVKTQNIREFLQAEKKKYLHSSAHAMARTV